MRSWKILAVDDEPGVLSVICAVLQSDTCDVETAENAKAAWEKLLTPGARFDIAILDRMMPGTDGLELLRWIKAEKALQHLPVIMQSGATSPEQIAEGIEAGAFYYLTKPYSPNALVGIVRAVKADIELRAEAAAQSARYIESFRYFTAAELRFSTLTDVNRVAGILAAMCPDPDQVSSGLTELLLNAVEHGNLGITYEEKKTLLYEDRWEREVERRLGLPEYRHRVATATFVRKPDRLEFRIEDQGSGFDWRRYLVLDPGRSLDPNGRGIAMARRYSFSTLEYQNNGTAVVATVALPPEEVSIPMDTN
jgi:DNA-binding response OmpR family regulator